MAYDRDLADRIHAALEGVSGVTGKPLFGGYGLFRRGVMFAGVWRMSLMVKLHAAADDALLEPHTSVFDPMNSGRGMTGWVAVAPPAIATDDQLKDWLDRAVAAIPVGVKKKPPKKRKK